MDDLISRQAAIEVFREDLGSNYVTSFWGIEKRLRGLPTIDPVKHGRWMPTSHSRWVKDHVYRCSVCGNILDMYGVNAGRGDANYCPNCGAKMGEEVE